MSPLQAASLPALVDRLEIGVWAVNKDFQVVLWNRFMARYSRIPAAEIVGWGLFDVYPDLPRSWLEKKIRSVFLLKNYAFTSWEQRPYLFRFEHNRPITGGVDAMRQNVTFLPILDAGGEVELVCATIFDCTDTAIYEAKLQRAIGDLEEKKREQQILIGRLEEAHNQLLQSEKLAAIGQLAAGVAHEINNPIGFVSSNLNTLEKYLTGLLRLIQVQSQEAPLSEAVRAVREEIDFDFLEEDAATLLEESRGGLDRVKKIVQDLRDFSRVDASEREMADLRTCLDSTLNIVWNEIKYRAEVVKEYGQIPDIECVPSQLNQVFMNMMVNAAQSIPDGQHGMITLRSKSLEIAGEPWVSIEVIDTGKGIPADTVQRIFEPFYTTKPVGKGTGLGLSISYTIVRKHGGRIEVDSAVGVGTTMRVLLPVRGAAQDP